MSFSSAAGVLFQPGPSTVYGVIHLPSGATHRLFIAHLLTISRASEWWGCGGAPRSQSPQDIFEKRLATCSLKTPQGQRTTLAKGGWPRFEGLEPYTHRRLQMGRPPPLYKTKSRDGRAPEPGPASQNRGQPPFGTCSDSDQGNEQQANELSERNTATRHTRTTRDCLTMTCNFPFGVRGNNQTTPPNGGWPRFGCNGGWPRFEVCDLKGGSVVLVDLNPECINEHRCIGNHRFIKPKMIRGVARQRIKGHLLWASLAHRTARATRKSQRTGLWIGKRDIHHHPLMCWRSPLDKTKGCFGAGRGSF